MDKISGFAISKSSITTALGDLKSQNRALQSAALRRNKTEGIGTQ
jgi:hypothetical protein